MKQQESEATPQRRILNTKQAADYTGRKAKTLETWRSRGGGPRFVKLGRSVGYPIDYLDQFIEAGARRSTSDRGEAA